MRIAFKVHIVASEDQNLPAPSLRGRCCQSFCCRRWHWCSCCCCSLCCGSRLCQSNYFDFRRQWSCLRVLRHWASRYNPSWLPSVVIERDYTPKVDRGREMRPPWSGPCFSQCFICVADNQASLMVYLPCNNKYGCSINRSKANAAKSNATPARLPGTRHRN